MLIVSRLDSDDMMTELCTDNRAVASPAAAYTHCLTEGIWHVQPFPRRLSSP